MNITYYNQPKRKFKKTKELNKSLKGDRKSYNLCPQKGWENYSFRKKNKNVSLSLSYHKFQLNI